MSSKLLKMPYSSCRSTFLTPCLLELKKQMLRKMDVPVTPYEVGRDELMAGWLCVERVQRRTGVPYVTLYDYPKRKPIRYCDAIFSYLNTINKMCTLRNRNDREL